MVIVLERFVVRLSNIKKKKKYFDQDVLRNSKFELLFNSTAHLMLIIIQSLISQVNSRKIINLMISRSNY